MKVNKKIKINNKSKEYVNKRSYQFSTNKSCSHLRTSKVNMDNEGMVFSNSKNKYSSKCFESPVKDNKNVLSLNTIKRHDHLYNLHKQKDINLKKLEEDVYFQNGITFKPKTNSNQKINTKATTNLRKHTRVESMPKFEFTNTYNTNIDTYTCSPKGNKSLSQKNLVRSYETTENNTPIITYDIMKTKESYLNSDPINLISQYNITKESISIIGKTTNEAFNFDSIPNSGYVSKKNSQIQNSKKIDLKTNFPNYKKHDFLSENESITNYKSETNK